jgi:hypothetical protein
MIRSDFNFSIFWRIDTDNSALRAAAKKDDRVGFR